MNIPVTANISPVTVLLHCIFPCIRILWVALRAHLDVKFLGSFVNVVLSNYVSIKAS